MTERLNKYEKNISKYSNIWFTPQTEEICGDHVSMYNLVRPLFFSPDICHNCLEKKEST